MYNLLAKRIVNSIIFVILLIVSILFNPSLSQAQKDDNILVLDELIKATLEKNPQLKSLYGATLADSARISQSGALPDPVLSLNLLNVPTNSFAFDQEPMTGKQIALRQNFPFPGKLSLTQDISSENTAISVAKYNEYANQLVRDLKNSYYDLFYLDKSLEITKKNQLLIGEFAQIAQTKYTVGKGLQQDVLKAQVEYSKMTNKLIDLQQKRNVIQSQINTLIYAPVDSILGKTKELGYLYIELSLDTLKSVTSRHRPILKGWEAIKKQSVLKVDLAKKDYWPDLSLFIAYTQRAELQNGNPGHDFLSGGISFNVPLYSGSKQSKKVEETQYSKNMIDDRYTQIINQIYFDLENTRSAIAKNSQLIKLYKTEVLPQAEQSVESALVGYRTEKIDFLTLINNQITLFNYKLDFYRSLGDYNKEVANLEFLVGKELIPNSERSTLRKTTEDKENLR